MQPALLNIFPRQGQQFANCFADLLRNACCRKRFSDKPASSLEFHTFIECNRRCDRFRLSS